VFRVLGQLIGQCIGKGHVGETKYPSRQVRSMTKQRGFAIGGMGLVLGGSGGIVSRKEMSWNQGQVY
jgi:hypothetical protein